MAFYDLVSLIGLGSFMGMELMSIFNHVSSFVFKWELDKGTKRTFDMKDENSQRFNLFMNEIFKTNYSLISLVANL